MDVGSDGERGRQQACRGGLVALAASACVVLLLTACGGQSRGGAAATGAANREQAALAYARCMRAHGVPDFPDPDSNGNFHLSSNQQAGGSKTASAGSSQEPNSISSQEETANQICNHLLDVGTQLSPAQMQHALGQLVKYAQCMRAHGIPDFPDPHTTSGGIGVPSGIGFDLSSIDVKSPQFGAASQACQSLAAHAKG
ncbi:MAG TPA: hypothetical protein VGI58_04305 [Streptosporangiaceae bacterium]